MKKFLTLALIVLTMGAFLAAGTPSYGQFYQSPPLAKFAQPLRNLSVFDPNGIPVAAPDSPRQPWWQPGVTHYTININQFQDQIIPGTGTPTTFWGYNPAFALNTLKQRVANPTQKHLGGIIVAERGKPVQITFQNNLPPDHIIPVDESNNFKDAAIAKNRTAVHLHGGFVPWISDGGPFDWWAPDGTHGPSFFNNEVLAHQNVGSNKAEYYYPNDQSARLMWYHDHNHDTTRINAYAGIASAYVVTDWYEQLLTHWPFNLPGPVDPRTIYLIFQDKIFVGDGILNQDQDPSWPGPTTKGSLWYAHIYDPTRWQQGPASVTPLPNPSVIPEFFGDTILVNGSVFPTATVEQRQYRIRMLNACNARFLNFRLVNTDTSGLEPDSYDWATATQTSPPPTLTPGFVVTQIGSEGGFLPYPAKPTTTFPVLDVAGNPTGQTISQPYLTLAPAERSDLIFDFRNVSPGTYILYNNAPAPYPAGDDINDYFPLNPNNPTVTIPGSGPNTRTIMQIVVKARTGADNARINLPPLFTPTDPFLIFQKPTVPSPLPAPDTDSATVTVFPFFKVKAHVRHLTLNEDFDSYGRLIQFLGTNSPTGTDALGNPLFGRDLLSPPTEIAFDGDYEIWEVANLTGDTHPIHFHLIDVQVLARQNFNVNAYTGTLTGLLQGNVMAPDANELGWKETVRMNPGQVTWVLMKFKLPHVPFSVPSSTRFASFGYNVPAGYKANEYVWHCHILEHEEHDMMRPVIVLSK